MTERPIRILCVDDNRLLAEAIERRFGLEPGFEWAGWVEEAADAPRAVRETHPDVAMVDIDMPGSDSFQLVRDLVAQWPDLRILMFSGHVRGEYIDRAMDAGAWGYVSKTDSLEEVIGAIRRVAAGEFVLTPDVRFERGGSR